MSVLAFLGGMGGGYLQQKATNRQNEREDKRDEMYAQRFGWEQDKALREKASLEDADALEKAHLDAFKIGSVQQEASVQHQGADGKMVSVAQPSAGDAEFTAFMQNEAKPEGATNYPETKVAQNYTYTGKDGVKHTFADEKLAKAHAELNPVTDVERLNAAAAKSLPMTGGFRSAMEFQAKARDAENALLAKDKQFKELQNENYFEALQYAEAGDAPGMVAAFEKSGKKFEGTPKITPIKRTVKGVGEIDVNLIEGFVKDKDGKVTPFKHDTYDLGLIRLPFVERLKTQAILNEAGDKSENNANILKIRQKDLANQITLQQLRNEGRANSSNGNSGQVGLSDIRTFNSDFANLLPKPADDINADPTKAQALQDANLDALTKGQTIFQTNASFGSVLTAPVVKQALRLSQNPANIYDKFDTETNRRVYFVNVGNTPVAIKSEKAQPNPVSK